MTCNYIATALSVIAKIASLLKMALIVPVVKAYDSRLSVVVFFKSIYHFTIVIILIDQNHVIRLLHVQWNIATHVIYWITAQLYLLFTCSYCRRGVVEIMWLVCLISSYGAPLAQRASYLALHSSLFVIDDYVCILSLTALTLWLKMYSQWCTHNHCWANLALA